MKTKIDRLNDVVSIAVDPGNAGANDYLRGMANGLILAKAIFDEKDPEYIISVLPDGTVNKMVGEVRQPRDQLSFDAGLYF